MPVQELLAGRGWSLAAWRRSGQAGFSVRPAAGGDVLFDIVLERLAHKAPAVRSVTPSFRLRCLPAAGKKQAPEGSAELAAALGALLESKRGGSAGQVLARVESHEGKEGRTLLLRSTLACNQRCPFCSVTLSRGMLPLASLEKELDLLSRQSGRQGTLVITGGEPTIDPQLSKVVAAARKRGWRDILLQTNAVLLAKPGLLESLRKLGLRRFFVSFHGHTSELYDQVTGSKGQFPAAVAGLSRLLAEDSCGLTINVVVNARNYRDLPDLIDFVGGLRKKAAPRRRVEIYLSMLNETSHDKTPSWAVDLAKAAPYLRRAAQRCRAHGLELARFGEESAFPACLMERPASHASPSRLPQDRVRYIASASELDLAIGRVKKAACRLCPIDPRCQGVAASYARLFGLSALKPPSGRKRA